MLATGWQFITLMALAFGPAARPAGGLAAARVAPDPPGAEAPDVRALAQERLAALRELARLAEEAWKNGAGSPEEVREANHLLFTAELEQAASLKDRIAVLEKYVAGARRLEDQTGQFARAGQGSLRTALRAKVDRLQAEIALARARTQAVAPAGPVSAERIALAENQVAHRQTALRLAQAQEKVVLAQVASARAQAAAARSAEDYAGKQVQRIEDLVKQNAVDARLADELRAKWESARAQRVTAEAAVTEGEGQVLVAHLKVDQARLEVADAELRLKILKEEGAAP